MPWINLGKNAATCNNNYVDSINLTPSTQVNWFRSDHGHYYYYNQNIIPMQVSSGSDEIIVLTTPKRDYYLEKETSTFISSIQETCQFASSQTVF